MDWYYARGDERMGPVDDAGMEELVATGVVGGDTLVWNEGMTDWQAYGMVAPGPVGSPDMPPSLFGEQTLESCAECGQSFPVDEMVSYESHKICANCKDVFFQRIREGGGVLSDLRYAGFWVRFGARFVDGVITNIAVYGLAFVVGFTGGIIQTGVGPEAAEQIGLLIGILGGAIGFILPLAYEIYFVGKHGATPGKMVSGLRVVMSDGSPVSYGRATGRVFALWLSYLTLFIGFIMAGFDSEKRALHDHICDTRVVYK